MIDALIPIVIMTGMFAMIFGIVYLRSRENMGLIERGLNPRNVKSTPRPFISLKYGLLYLGAGLGLLSAYIVDHTIINHSQKNYATYTIGGHHNRWRKKFIVVDTIHAGNDTSIQGANANNANNADGDEQHSIVEVSNGPDSVPIYFALIAIGGGIGLIISYRIEKKELLDKKEEA